MTVTPNDLAAEVDGIARHIAKVSVAHGNEAATAAISEGMVRIRELVQREAPGAGHDVVESLVDLSTVNCLKMVELLLQDEIDLQRRRLGTANDL